jgi:hypothetical protein
MSRYTILRCPDQTAGRVVTLRLVAPKTLTRSTHSSQRLHQLYDCAVQRKSNPRTSADYPGPFKDSIRATIECRQPNARRHLGGGRAARPKNLHCLSFVAVMNGLHKVLREPLPISESKNAAGVEHALRYDAVKFGATWIGASRVGTSNTDPRRCTSLPGMGDRLKRYALNRSSTLSRIQMRPTMIASSAMLTAALDSFRRFMLLTLLESGCWQNFCPRWVNSLLFLLITSLRLVASEAILSFKRPTGSAENSTKCII